MRAASPLMVGAMCGWVVRRSVRCRPLPFRRGLRRTRSRGPLCPLNLARAIFPQHVPIWKGSLLPTQGSRLECGGGTLFISIMRRGENEEDDEDGSLDKNEAILWMKPGMHSTPWHPATMSAPFIYKICLMGPCGSGKSSFAHRLVAHTFDPGHRPTRATAQLFWRHFEQATGHDIMVELEDTPGILAESGELQHEGMTEVEQLLTPLVWFEKRRGDAEDVRATNASDETHPLLPSGAPRVSSAVGGRKARRDDTGMGGLSQSMGEFYARTTEVLGSSTQRANPIGEDRKRMGFGVVADLSSRASFDAAHAIVDRIFERLQFDLNDPIACPVSIVIAGNKSDLRNGQRAMASESELRAEIESRYENRRVTPPQNVLYIECSARTNRGLEQVRLQALNKSAQPARNPRCI